MPATSPLAAAFDALAPGYDALFTDHPSGRIVRRGVWRVADEAFAGADRVLDLGCGTGVDAVHFAGRGMAVTALDIAPQMVAAARRAAIEAGHGDRITVGVADVGAPATWTDTALRSERRASFAGALADFGVLNCIDDLAPLGSALATLIRPGGRFVAVVMGRLCAWETVLGIARGDVRRATRRRRGSARADFGTGPWSVWYRSPPAIARGLGPSWSLERAVPIGAVVPPSWAVPLGSAFDRAWLWRTWEAAETAARRLPTAAAWSDHVAVVLRRDRDDRLDIDPDVDQGHDPAPA